MVKDTCKRLEQRNYVLIVGGNPILNGKMTKQNNPNQRTELSKYYKWVKKCRLCGKLYGCDGHEEEKNVCPRCNIDRWKQ